MSPIGSVQADPSSRPASQSAPQATPVAVTLHGQPSKVGPLLTFLYIVFMVIFAFSFLALIGGVIATIIMAGEDYPPRADDVVFNMSLLSGGLVGTLLSGIGWTLSVIAERLANRGLL